MSYEMEDLRKKLLDREITADTYEKLLRSLLDPPAKNQQIDLLPNLDMQLKNALQMQLSVERELHVQLEVQRSYRLLIDEQGKQLEKMSDQHQQHKGNGSQNMGITSPHNDQSSTNPKDGEILDLEDASENTISTPSRRHLAKRACHDTISQIENITGLHCMDALQMQLAIQRQLHEQLEIQRTLQLRMEEKARQLKKMFDQNQQQKANLSHNSEITSSL